MSTSPDEALRTWRFSDIRYVPDVPRYWARALPDKVAFIDGPRTRTYAELDRTTNRIANCLLDRGVRRDECIGMIGKNSVEFFELWFAAGKAGCALAPFNWRLAPEELLAIVDNATPRIVFVAAEFVDTMKDVQARCTSRFEIVAFDTTQGLSPFFEGADDTDPRTPLVPTDVSLVSYTSGTTGTPKGVMASHEAFAYSFLCNSLDDELAWKEHDVLLLCMPTFHLGGSWLSLGAPYYGATVTMLPAFEPTAFLATLRRDRPTIAPLVPAAIQVLLGHADRREGDFASVESVLYFGSPIALDVARRATEAFGCRFQQFYGTTEVYFTTMLLHDPDILSGPRLASCGKAVPLVSIKIVDADGNEVPRDTVGEIVIRTPMAFSGYWRRPEATAAVYRDGWYSTGDVGRMDEDGFIFIVDRLRDMIISGGENIYSTEVERALQKHPGVHACAVIGLPDERWGERVVAVVILAAATVLTEDEVIEHCRVLIARYKVPKQVIFVESMPMTPTGKVKKAVLAKQLGAR